MITAEPPKTFNQLLNFLYDNPRVNIAGKLKIPAGYLGFENGKLSFQDLATGEVFYFCMFPIETNNRPLEIGITFYQNMFVIKRGDACNEIFYDN
jgi:hypothetical protein